MDTYNWLAETLLWQHTASWMHLSCLTAEVTVIITFLQTGVLGNEHESLVSLQLPGEKYPRYLLCPMSEQPKSETHDDSCVSSCFGLSTHPSVSQAIHFPTSECAIYLDGLCLKGFAYATDTLSKALRLPVSPACLWHTWWYEWQSLERKQRGKVREKTDRFNQFTTLRKRRTCIQTIHIWTL